MTDYSLKHCVNLGTAVRHSHIWWREKSATQIIGSLIFDYFVIKVTVRLLLVF